MPHTPRLKPWHLALIAILLTGCSGQPAPKAPAPPAPAPVTQAAAPVDQRQQVANILRAWVHDPASPMTKDPLSVKGMSLAQGIASFYQQRQYQPAWQDADMLTQLVTALEDLRFDGLDPNEYSLQELKQKQAQLPTLTSLTEQAELDLLASRACIKALVHLRLGKVDPAKLEPQWNFSSPVLDTREGLSLLQKAVQDKQLEPLFQRARPQQPVYTQLREGLRDLYHVQSLGGWPQIPAGPTLKPGTTDNRIPPLRQRLIAASLLDTQQASSTRFDDSLKQAVIRFQKDQNLDADGAVGAQTLAVLNVPVDQRIAQVKANLERARWLLHEVNGDFVWVDIAGYKVYLYRDGKAIWSARVQVGKPYRSTPIFKSRLSYVTFNPTWTVPPTIFKEDVLPKVRHDLAYLQQHRLTVLDSRGTPLDPATIDWNSPGNILLREEAGPLNALGKVVIRFPNKHAIYMHDTPSKGNFSRGSRALSSGCIRVERPLELVELLFNDPQKWNREAIDTAIAKGETRDVGFKVRIPILLTYSTVGITESGRIAFKQDIYQRDPPLIAALDRRSR